MKRKHRKGFDGEWGEWKPEKHKPKLGEYARNPELDPNYMKHLLLEEDDYIPTEEDPDMDIILQEDIKNEDISNRD